MQLILRRFLLVLLLAAAPSALASDLTGDWTAAGPRPDGGTMHLMFRFKQDGTRLTGIVSAASSDLAIVNGQVNGDQFSFAVQLNFGERSRTLTYGGTVKGDTLEISAPTPRSDAPVHLTARRATAAEVAANWPERIPPPALHPVPANGLARTPPMGWNSWNHFAGKVDDKTVREIADTMAGDGMQAAGYVYVNIDDTWQGTRDAQGNIRTNDKFPNMKALADYVHSKGLKLGIYSGPGTKTCAGFAGSYGHEAQDARTYAAWGIDYLKYDWCSAAKIYQDGDMQAVYQKMGEALRATGRPIVYSLCQYGRDGVWEWGPAVGGNLWRTTGDISDDWKSMTRILVDQVGLEQWAGPGHWNDPDMLEVGNGGMSAEEYRTHMSLWCILAAPLLAGNDLRTASRETLDILENPEVIAVDQDALGQQGHRVTLSPNYGVWAKPLAGGAQAVALVNSSDEAATVSVEWKDLDLKGPCQVRDLWAHADRGRQADGFSSNVPSHGVVLIKVTP
ncbi:MAG TPA: glycoside hydrolase family 27 protein [Terriglobia bacterium]|jgi:alpha-galactosidase|nr:glycoside hydrolase family 27 protein [Terriglobia bacterium]